MAKTSPSPNQACLEDLLYQALETEIGGIEVYKAAIACTVNEALREEWGSYLEETRKHQNVLVDVLEAFGLDPAFRPPSRDILAGIAGALVASMEQARAVVSPEQAELVACEAVVLAETKDHANWELLAHVAAQGSHPHLEALRAAVEAVGEDEAHHLYHTQGWCRESWIRALGFPAVLPPPEELRHVETAIGASRAEQARDSML